MAQATVSPKTANRPQTSRQRRRPSFFRILLAMVAILVWLAALAAVAGVFAYQYSYAGRIFPGVSVRGMDLSGLSVAQAQDKLQAAFNPYPLAPITVRYGDQTWTLTAEDLGVNFDAHNAAEAAYRVGRRFVIGGDFRSQLGMAQANLQDQLNAYRFGREVMALETIDRTAGLAWLQQRAQAIDRPAIEATLRVDGLTVSSSPSQVGYALDLPSSYEAIYQALVDNRGETVDLTVKENKPLLADVSQAEGLVRQVFAGPVTLTASEPDLDAQQPAPSYTISAEELASLVSLQMLEQPDGSRQVAASFDVSPLREKVQGWAAELAREPRDAKLDFDPKTYTISVVTPSQVGRSLDVDATLKAINDAALGSERSVTLPLSLVEPAVNMHKIDQMGIKELVSEGTTSFKGSSADRVHNIVVASKAVDNAVVAPGEIFSFNKAVGDVSAETGYKDSLIIWGDRTAIGVGGGLCQVSTTVFRAAYYGGFPLEERWNHGYVVSWYGTPGLDATVYTPNVDFKFRNTTDHYLIVKSEINTSKGTLTFRFYGTKPDWTVDVTGPKVLKETPAPPAIYQTDNSLAPGEVRQVDWSHSGVDVEWRRVVKDGQGNVVSDETLRSEYSPWPAYFLVGPSASAAEQAPAPAEPPPAAPPPPTDGGTTTG